MLALLLPFLSLPLLQTSNPEPMEGVLFIEGVHIWREDAAPTGPHQVLIQDGFLVAVGGPDQALLRPAGASVLRPLNEKWVLYPGMLHANYSASDSDSTMNPYANSDPDPRSGPLPQMESGSRSLMHGWRNATDQVDWDPEKAKEWREAGFTSAQLIPSSGILRGHASVVALNDLP